MTLAFLWLWRVNPDLLSFISVEEGVLELLTAIILGSSFVLGLFFIIKHRQSHLRLIYISLPLLSMLAFLDEISYGQGILNFQTFSIFGFYIDGFHDILVIMHILIERNPEYFHLTGFGLMGLIFVFIITAAAKDIFPNLERLKKHYLGWTALFLTVFTFTCLIFLLSIPADRKNAWIFGYSPSRILIVVAFSSVILSSSWFTTKIWRNVQWSKYIIAYMDVFHEKSRRRYLTIVLLTLNYLVGLFLGMGKYTLSPQAPLYAYAVRLLPLVFWLMVTSATLLIVFLIWDIDSPKSLSKIVKQVFLFFQRFQAYQFLLAAILFAVLAQLRDVGLIHFNLSFSLEEILEFYASIILLFAILSINIQPQK